MSPLLYMLSFIFYYNIFSITMYFIIEFWISYLLLNQDFSYIFNVCLTLMK